MFVIFGWGRQEISNYGPVYHHTCPNCNNAEYWQLQKVSRYLTLFFVPIFPHDNRHWYYCPICSRGVEIDRDTAKHYKIIAAANTAYINKAITEEELDVRTKVANDAIAQIEKLRNIKYLKESKDFTAIVCKKTDEELLFIANDSPDKYSPAFLIAVEQEMSKRDILPGNDNKPPSKMIK